MNIVIRADASARIGAGHLMRTLALADTLQAAGAACTFVSAACPAALQERVRAHGHAVRMLGDEHLCTDEAADAAATLQFVGTMQPDWLIVDHYQLSAKWEFALRPSTVRLMAIDDLASRPHHADLLLDQNPGRSRNDYAVLVPRDCTVLTGSRYALLRPEFAKVRARSLTERAGRPGRHVLVTLGGADPLGLTSGVLSALQAACLPADAQVTVVAGAAFTGIDAVAAAFASLPFATRLLDNVGDMATLMAEADVAISAAGSTLWELCCTGVPALAIIVADNQRHSAAELERRGAGLAFDAMNEDWNILPDRVNRLFDPATLAGFRSAASELVDGLGCGRVAQEMLDAG